MMSQLPVRCSGRRWPVCGEGHSLFLMLAALAVLAGCEKTVYEITMETEGKALNRQLTVWRESQDKNGPRLSELSPDLVQHLTSVYPAAQPLGEAKKRTFVGRFVGRTPDDVGGAGSYTQWETSLGSVSAYVERFRGDDNLSDDVQQRKEAIDQLVGWLSAWLESELGGEPDFPKLKDFVHGQLVRDLWNISLHLWAYHVAADRPEDPNAEMAVRIAQYLMERDYFTPDDMPRIVRAFDRAGRDDPDELSAMLQRLVAKKMGLTAEASSSTVPRFFADVTRVEASLDRYLRTTDEYQQLYRDWEQQRQTDQSTLEPGSASPPSGTDVLTKPAIAAFLSNMDFMRAQDSLRVSIATRVSPFLSNGTWDAKTSAIRWSRSVAAADGSGSEPPSVLFALWSIPNEQSQTRHFGRVALQGEALAEYCFWYRCLDEGEAQHWDRFVAGLQKLAPDPQKVIQQLAGFRFPDDREGEPSRATSVTNHIITGLGGRPTAPDMPMTESDTTPPAPAPHEGK